MRPGLLVGFTASLLQLYSTFGSILKEIDATSSDQNVVYVFDYGNLLFLILTWETFMSIEEPSF